jgi:hypothetical protein
VTVPARDRGSAEALGLVLIAPVVIGLALLVVSLGRNVDARAQVRTAAESAAQAAALERSPSAAIEAGRRVGLAMLTDVDSCADPDVRIDPRDFRPGGRVVAIVSCTVSNRSIEVVQREPRRETVQAFATIDPFRATSG